MKAIEKNGELDKNRSTTKTLEQQPTRRKKMKNTVMILSLIGIMATSPLMTSSQAIAGERSQEYDSVSSFCRDRLVVLKRAYRIAEIESQQGNHDRSLIALEGGLKEAESRITPRYANTLTSKAIKRGIVLLNNLKATEGGRNKIRTLNNFLMNYYLFIDHVSNQLDIPYFSISNAGFGKISPINTKFETLFVNFAQAQVKMILSTMTLKEGYGLNATIYPVGSSNLLLRALEVTTKAMADDLSESIFSTRHACTIDALESLSTEISEYLEFQDSYADDFVAVQELVGRTERLLGGSLECGGRGGLEVREEARTQDAIKDSFSLLNGTTQQVRLNGGKQIKNIIISAEGIRGPAVFDVVVNGEVKGTVYVPDRDPSYFVTIKDYASSIELVSRTGTALISRILVVTE